MELADVARGTFATFAGYVHAAAMIAALVGCTYLLLSKLRRP